jgi:transposase
MHCETNHVADAETFPLLAIEPDMGECGIGLSQEQQAELTALLARRPRVRHWRFLRTVQLCAGGLQPSEIAAELHCSPTEVARWIELGQVTGFHEATAHHRSGRAKLLDARGNELLAALIQSDPRSRGHRAKRWTIPLLRNELEQAGYIASGSTVWRAARRLGWVHRHESLPETEAFRPWSSRSRSNDQDPPMASDPAESYPSPSRSIEQ